MVSVESKINIFKEELAQKIETDRKKRIEEAELEAEKGIMETEERLEKRQAELVERFERQQKRQVSRILSDGFSKAKKAVLNTQEEIRDDFQKHVLKMAKEYVDKPIYKEYLRNSLGELRDFLANTGELVIFARKEDQPYLESIIKKEFKGIPVSFRELPQDQIGGFRVSAQDGRVSYDFTVLSLIKDNKRFIAKNLSKALRG